jgi:hypothetical protein
MTTAASNPVKRLLSSFKDLGLSAAQVRHFLPEWWEDEAAEDETTFLELQILLARRLNVEIGTLQSKQPKPEFRSATRRFKTVHPEGSTQLAVASAVGYGLAQVLAAACHRKLTADSLTAEQMRAQLLEGRTSVTLDSLCTWLWERGVPVVHITHWPKQLRRPDAMCVRVGERAVVMVVRKETAPARLAYLVAHEVGHVMSGHLKADNNAVLVDDTLPVDDQDFAKDADEGAADKYALRVLGGEKLAAAAKSLKGTGSELELAVQALRVAKPQGLDAGQVILAWARASHNWPLATSALKYLMTTQVAPIVINDAARRFIDFDELSDDGREHLEQLTGISAAR